MREKELVYGALNEWLEFNSLVLTETVGYIGNLMTNQTLEENIFKRVGHLCIIVRAHIYSRGKVGFGGVAEREGNMLQDLSASRAFVGDSVEAILAYLRWVLEKVVLLGWKELMCCLDVKDIAQHLT
ncbi:pentatricopeptide repeat (PPR) superfamily protein [Striga asiatica]|uniref:Pentatricopeptide repeat (PPR) superfamily protein n=1 Tax=Striga asiatica TaxID=4170 RepID=A0A5A7NXI5_STRAF|nr:pentatricopeptide repeat (PPR) superfamily protein [Striga asiatica]